MSKFSDRLNQARKDESIRSVAKRAAADDSVGESTLHPYFRDGHGRPTVQVVKALAKALGIATDELWTLADMPSDGGPWSPPDESRFMNDRQRQAVSELIRSFVQTQGAAHDVETTQESPASPPVNQNEKNVGSSNNSESDPLTGLDRWRGDAGEVEDGDDSADKTG